MSSAVLNMLVLKIIPVFFHYSSFPRKLIVESVDKTDSGKANALAAINAYFANNVSYSGSLFFCEIN